MLTMTSPRTARTNRTFANTARSRLRTVTRVMSRPGPAASPEASGTVADWALAGPAPRSRATAVVARTTGRDRFMVRRVAQAGEDAQEHAHPGAPMRSASTRQARTPKGAAVDRPAVRRSWT